MKRVDSTSPRPFIFCCMIEPMYMDCPQMIGTIRIEPAADAPRQPSDDSSLGGLLQSFATRQSLEPEASEGCGEFRLVVATRLSRLPMACERQGSVRANLAQLWVDLQLAYEDWDRQTL
jgi:hypothetical protein